MDFRDRHVVVTGGAGALGSAVVAMLAGAGAICHVPCHNEAEAERFRPRAPARTNIVVTGDLAREGAVAGFYGAIAPLWASIHIAGGFAASPFRDADEVAIRRQIDMNFVSCALCCSAAIRAMSGGGRIVNVSARPGLEWRSGAGMVAYAASKAAVAALTAALAEEVGAQDILVNAVAPSIIDTAANRAAMPNADFAKWPKPDEIAATITFLASPQNRVTRGGVVPVYGKS